MSNIRLDGVSHIQQTNKVNQSAAPINKPIDEKKRTKQLEISGKEAELLKASKKLFDAAPDVDMDKINQIKAQIESGEMKFEMKKVAEALVRK
ncbi:flagellar biosynthesis anti-sigma factor FlgM [Vibrio sp. SS-MA-C1-2]|uniref:flagellar biosynthesis anti-sigma factor FlgM n=1 Tax=Vibrio sp. SS-MA-C1-2 TaxID=2908646 RepID=UPI001F18A26B|nr:flagellar biosynthesis anti-sigma factor FlgM [Vibrio sp. SS-MA-C1-2]UJF18032.1 flagellar biosynthesis anti-sigma factor FlgM [Vibrio sp. SS-MA-C1-2]